MKIKDIILFICMLPIFLLSSCVNDDLDNSQCGTVDLVLTTDFVQTKAASGYSYASGEELKIYDCVVAIYDTNGSQIAFASRNFSGTSTETIGGKPAYRFSNVTSKTGAVTIWVIANSGLGDAAFQNKTIAEIKALNVQTATFDASSLVKVGSTEATLSTNGGSINVELTQLAARVDVSFKTTDTNWKFKMASIAVDKVNQKSDLVLGAYSTSSYTYNTKLQEVSYNGTITSDTVSFYTYEKVTASSPVVIKIKGELKEGTYPGEIKEYTINLNPTIGGSVTTNGIIHGNLYDVSGNIDITTKNVTFDVTVKPWIPIDINASIKDVHYLFVSEHDIKMPNILSYSFTYASDLQVNYEIVSVSYTGYSTTGNPVVGTYNPGTDQYPNISIVGNSINVSFRSTPINYVPTYITLKIKTATNNLFETVNIIHYPSPYIEVAQNNITANIPLGTPNRDYGGVPNISSTYGGRSTDNTQTNYNVFMITTIAPGSFITGDPKASDNTTLTTEEANNIVSPKFVIASQRGITNIVSYANAQERCRQYTEYPYMTVGSWRIPTKAELKYIAQLQNNSNSAVKKLLEGDSYWSAYWVNGKGIQINMSDASETLSSSSTYVRCVHDVY